MLTELKEFECECGKLFLWYILSRVPYAAGAAVMSQRYNTSEVFRVSMTIVFRVVEHKIENYTMRWSVNINININVANTGIHVSDFVLLSWRNKKY